MNPIKKNRTLGFVSRNLQANKCIRFIGPYLEDIIHF
jgi:hypothetical protein